MIPPSFRILENGTNLTLWWPTFSTDSFTTMLPCSRWELLAAIFCFCAGVGTHGWSLAELLKNRKKKNSIVTSRSSSHRMVLANLLVCGLLSLSLLCPYLLAASNVHAIFTLSKFVMVLLDFEGNYCGIAFKNFKLLKKVQIRAKIPGLKETFEFF